MTKPTYDARQWDPIHCLHSDSADQRYISDSQTRSLDEDPREDAMGEEEFPTDSDLIVLEEALVAGEDREVTPDEVTALAQWINHQLVGAAMAELVLEGRLLVRRLPSGEFHFRIGQLGEAPGL